MEAYPQGLVSKSYPLIVLSGLDPGDGSWPTQEHALQHNGIKIGSDSPAIVGSRAQDLLAAFMKLDESNVTGAYEETLAQRHLLFKFRVCRRQYSLPVHKASPQPSPADSPIEVSSPTSSYGAALHSPLSPLSPGSPLNPDGLMTPLWNEKHQRVVPCVFLSFFHLTSEANVDTNRDGQLKSEIAALKASIDQSRYRTRLAIILVGDESAASAFNASDLDSRIENIRKSVRLDSSNAFYLPMETPSTEFVTFASSVLSSLRPQCTEYYRDLTRHARRKRDKGSSSSFASWNMKSPSQGLPKLAWICRYEYKLGIFAEFRSEMDVAERHYAAAWDALCDSQGPFESLSSWSPRWDESRLLADAASIRLIRCQLSISLTNSAVKSWRNHRRKMFDLVTMKGKGTSNYGWEAWEARWARIMAELTVETGTLASSRSSTDSTDETMAKPANQVFAPKERFIQPDQTLDPWEYLHHVGYWFALSAFHTKRRRDLAQAISEEDRTPPGRSPASQIARQNETYDSYLCPQPHEEFQFSPREENVHSVEMISTLGRGTREFSDRDQHRMADCLRVKLCRELIEMDKYQEALSLLKPMWMGTRWRQEQWWSLVQEISNALHECAIALNDETLQIGTLWELSSSVFEQISSVKYDLSALIRKVASNFYEERTRHMLRLNDENLVSCCSVGCAFADTDGAASEPTLAQITLQSHAMTASASIEFSKISVDFDGIIDSIEIQHSSSVTQTKDGIGGSKGIQNVVLEDVSNDYQMSRGSKLKGVADIRVEPREIKVFNVEITPQEAGEIIEKSTTLVLKQDEVEVQIFGRIDIENRPASFWWSVGNQSGSSPVKSVKPVSSRLSIHPRPPKLEVSLANIHEVYCTSEVAIVDIDFLNGEDEEANVQLQLRALGGEEESASLAWLHQEDNNDSIPPEYSHFLDSEVGKMAPSCKRTKQLSVNLPSSETTIVLEARVSYRLSSNAEIPISKLATAEILVIRPFSASHRVRPDLHPNEWPDYLDLTTRGKPITRWHVDMLFSSSAPVPLHVDFIALNVSDIDEGMKSWISDQSEDCKRTFSLQSKEQRRISFTMDIEKDYDDSRDPILNPKLEISWHRGPTRDHQKLTTDHGGDTATVQTNQELPPMTLAANEPRVLASTWWIPRSAIHIQADSKGAEEPESDTDPKTGFNATIPSATKKAEEENEEEESDAVVLLLILENPTDHMRTFGITVDPSDDFAFSGHKNKDWNVRMKSRRVVKYVLLPFERGKWVRVAVKVVDVEVRRMVSIHATGRGLRGAEGRRDKALWLWSGDA